MPTRGKAYKNAEYLAARYRELRRLKLCINCKQDAGDYSRCEKCRALFNKNGKAAA